MSEGANRTVLNRSHFAFHRFIPPDISQASPVCCHWRRFIAAALSLTFFMRI